MLQYHVIRRAEDIEHVLRDRVALLPGVRDRENRPIIFVPARDVNSHPDHLHNLLTYLYDVTQDDAKPRGFTIVIDMRRGTTWEIVKPILKFLQEYFPAPINCVYIVKPDKFLEKYKISTAKYKFDIQMISLEALPKFIDFCQIIREFGGSMPYDHDEWIELRKDIERIVQRICEILKNLDRISTEMDNAEMPVDVQSSQAANAKHQDLYPIIAAVPIDEFKTEAQSLRDRVTSSGHRQSVSTRNVSVMTSPNPDLLSVFPQMDQLLQNLVIRRNNVYYKWDSRKNDLDRYCQLKLFEQDAEELSKWICSQFNVLTHRFVLIGESEMEANRLLKEHKDFADSVNKIQVSYEQVITVGHRLLQQFQSIGMNRIESISQQLQADWAQFVGRIEQRTALLQIALNMHRKCDTFLKNAELWLPNVGVDPHSIRSEDELPTAVQRHNEFQKLYQTAYSEAFEETNKLARVLRKYFGESALQLPAWELVEEQIRQITRTNRELHSIWEARNETIQIKASSTVFNQDLNSVLNWLTDHGEPFMRRKIGIGVDRPTAAQFCENHDKFRAVAHNTHRNAEQIFHMVQIIIRDSDESTRTETLQRVEELRRRIDKFRKCIEHRTNLLCLASNFFLHYEEIMQWYARMDSRMGNIRIVPNSVELCEQNKDKFQSENDGTVQAYERVMVEAQQLLQSLKQQRELLEVDNTEATVHVQTLTRNIENRHQHEKERWQEQRVYLSAALKISTFLRDCNEINKQLESWRQDLEGLKHSVTSTVEIIKQYHTQNTVKVQQVVSDAMKQLSEILQLIHAKNLQLLCAVEPSQPLKEMVTTAANRLHNLEQEVMHIAKDVSNRIELSIQLGKLRQIANGVIGAVEREQMRLMQLYFIPGNQQEVDMELRYFHEFRIGIESTEENVNRFYDEKEKFSNLLTLALESHAETRVKAENLCTEVKTKWQALVGLMDSRNKLLSAANSYYKYTRMLLPTSQSIENDLLGDGEKHFCKSRDWDTLQWCYEAIQERIEKHQSHKERFMEASVYAQRTADQFIRQIRRCDAPREHMEMRLFEVQRCKDTVRERQAFIFRLWMSTNAQLEHCRDATKIQLMVKEIVDWSDREMATCAKIKHTVDQHQLNKNRGDHRAKMEELLERCLEQWDLVKVERYETRKLLQETKHFMEGRLNELHVTEVKSGCSLAQIKFKNIWEMVMECEQVVRAALSLDEANIQRRKSEQEKLSLDRFSDSTIDEKLSAKECTADQDGENRKILEPMKELLKSEKDYIEDLRRCVDIYLYGYRTSGSMCPMAIRGKEREIFGNIEELYQFHCSVFLGELVAYAMNPEDVGYCFIEWMEKLKELYADYCLNKEENNYLICLPETIKMFNDIREQNGIELSHDLQSLVIKPVQRVTKYHILLKELLKHCAKNSKEIKNAYEIVLSIPKLANDRMHLKSFENSQGIAVGDFVMQDTFLVSEPKRYFKRERELQVFLFESNIVFTKKEELSSKKMGYVYKDSILLREVHVVEHIEGDITKFGLRKSAFPHQNDQNTTVLKANSETVRISWVKMLRDLKLDMGRQQKTDENSLTSAGGTNRSSRDSQSSITAVLSSSAVAIQAAEDRNSAQSLENASCTATNSVQRQHQQVALRHEADTNDIVSFRGKPERQWLVAEDFTADRPEQLCVMSGQRVEMLSHQSDNGEFVRVTLLVNNNNVSSSGGRTKATGFVPRRILVAATASHTPECESPSGVSSHSPADETHTLATALSAKRTSIRRFFSSNQSTSKSSHHHHHHPHRPPSNPNVTFDQPCTSFDQSSSSSFHSSAVASNSGVDLLPVSPPPPPVLSSVCHPSSSPPSSSTTATTTLPQPLPSSAVTRAIDPDLPPPMSQLSSAVGTTEAVNGVGLAQQPNSLEMAGESNNACLATDEATSSLTNAASLANTPVEAMSSEESARLKRSYVLQELVESERTYAQDLASISDGYIASLREMELSDEDREKVKIIFANIEQILDFHKTFFLKEVEKSLHDHDAAGNAFIKYERRLHTFYVKYCQNKPKSDFLVSQDYFEQLFSDIKEKLGHKVALSDLLIKPVQRITKYQLMLSDILKYTHRSGDNAEVLERAHDIMRVVPKACDDMMQVGRLQGFQGNLTAQGRLIFQGTLFISDGGVLQPFKGKERRVFLFEQSVIIAECIPPRKEYGNPTYNFKNQIMVNKMMLDERVPDEPLRFVLQSSDPNQQATYVAQAASADDKEQWLAKLSAQLDQQKTFLNALVDPKRYQNQLANSIGAISLSGKKDSSGSLGTPTSPAPPSAVGGTSPTKPLSAPHKSSSSKLFGFGGKSKS